MHTVIEKRLEEYFEKWEILAGPRVQKEFFQSLKPVAVGWKVADAQEYSELYRALRGSCDSVVETWMNDRWIATMHLKDATLAEGITIIKLMQRRPGSSDALGLDHVDFYSPQVEGAEVLLEDETKLKWSKETNDAVDDYSWISIWFSGTEAKLKFATVLDIVQLELKSLNEHIKNS